MHRIQYHLTEPLILHFPKILRMKTYYHFSNVNKTQLPSQFTKDDVRYPEEFAECFIKEFSDEADVIFDPFAGFGTTILVAERLNRAAYGVEYNSDRCEYVRSLMQHPDRLINGDSLKLSELNLPNFDLSLTSPPYMGHHHRENPFTSYTTEGNGYDAYLSDLRKIYTQIAKKMNEDAQVLIEVSNLKHTDAPITTLAWDIAREIAKVLTFRGETVITWEPIYNYGYSHSYVLHFTA